MAPWFRNGGSRHTGTAAPPHQYIHDLITRILAFRDAREWKPYHTPENLAKSICIEAAELLAEFQWESPRDTENVADELADVMIYCIQMADALGIDVVQAMHAKMDKNERKYPVDKARGNAKKYTELGIQSGTKPEDAAE